MSHRHAHGEPDAWERARPARWGARGNGTARKTATAPLAYPITSFSSRPRRLTRSAASTGTSCAAPASKTPRRTSRTRWSLLKNPADLTDRQTDTLAALHAAGGKVPRAWAMKEMVRAIFAPGLTEGAVAELIERLLARLSRSRLKPFVRLGRTIRKHRDGILAARRLKLSNARAEALNNKVKLIVRRAYGFHSANAALALIHLTCGPVTLTLPHEHSFV